MTKRYWYIIFAVTVFIAVGVLIWGVFYRPQFSSTFSGNNADWGDFGEFFFGLGTRLLTGLTVFIMLGIDSHLHRSNIIKQYEEYLKNVVELEGKCANDIIRAHHYMGSFLIVIMVSDNFSKEIRKEAERLCEKWANYDITAFAKYMDPNDNNPKIPNSQFTDDYPEIVGELGEFWMDLSANKIITKSK